MTSLQERIQRANTLLSPYAVPHEGILGRAYPDPEDEIRFPFQRDRDRIIHTQAFRRLKGKTQVFVAGTHDHVRSRLTHSMEVAQVSRDIARALGLNEDLAESIALAHDLGHPPFGHAGEEALDLWMRAYGQHFEHNEQSHRVVTVLAEHTSQYLGLNLNQEILEGLLKHTTPHDQSGNGTHGATLEAQVVNIADEIAYTGHDVDDGLRSDLFTTEDLMSIPLAREAIELTGPRQTSLRGGIIHLLVHDLLCSTEMMITDQSIRSLEDVRKAKKSIVRFADETSNKLGALRAFLWQRMYLHPDVLSRSKEGQDVITELCMRYHTAPTEKIIALQERTGSALPEAIKDYIAGMTDDFAMSSLNVK